MIGRTEKYLKQLDYINYEIDLKLSRRDSIRHYMGSTGIKPDPVTGGPGGRYDDRYEGLFDPSDDDLAQRVQDMVALRERIAGEIDQVEERLYRVILEECHINRKPIKDVAKGIGYSYSHTRNVLYKDALRAFYKQHKLKVDEHLMKLAGKSEEEE